MADPHKTPPLAVAADKDIDQAITSLKKGSHLLKYGRRGKPKFCPFRLSNDESLLIWYSGKEEKQIKLSAVSKIIPGQRTATFQRYPRPEKEYQSFSLIYNDRSLDLICKDKAEAELWFVALKALVTRGNNHKWRFETRCESLHSDSSHSGTGRSAPAITPFDPGDTGGAVVDDSSQNKWVKAFSEIISYSSINKTSSQAELTATSSFSSVSVDNSNNRNSTSEAFRVSLSSAVSSSSQGSYHEDFEGLSDIFIWGEGIGDGVLVGGEHGVGTLSSFEMDAFLPKALELKVVLDVHSIGCGYKHAVLVTKQGEIFSWGKESGGRLGHGVEVDVYHPKLISTLCGVNIELVACGENHTCAVTYSGDLYTWGDGTHNSGLLGHGNEVSHWLPKKVSGSMEGIRISYVSCGPWHTAIVTSAGQLFTFGDGTFGALGHGDNSSSNIPREVETLKGLRTTSVSCGVWHTAAVVEVINEYAESSTPSPSGKLFTWGDGDKNQLGHVDREPRLVPECVIALDNENICRVACGDTLTVALTTSGHVYTMGSAAYGQLGCPASDGKVPTRVEDTIGDSFVEDVACGSCHVAVLTSRSEICTWGKGLNGQLGHGDNDHRNKPTLVEFLKDKQVQNVFCGSNFTVVVCLHKWVPSVDHSVCSSCHNPFGFRRKRHNCYNCGLVYCKACSSRRSMKAALAPNSNKPYRVCDDCYSKLKKAAESVSSGQTPGLRSVSLQDSRASKIQGTLLRLSSFGSIAQTESSPSKLPESRDSHVFPSLNGKLPVGIFSPSKSSNSLSGESRKLLPVSEPTTRISCQSTSPSSSKTSPRKSCEDINDDSKKRNDIFSQEVISLKEQVEDLTQKSKSLEAELEKTSKQLKEVSAVAADEAAKCKSAKEVIKSLTAQLKEMVKRLPEGQNADPSTDSNVETTKNNLDQSTDDVRHTTNTITPVNESSSNTSSRILSNGTKTQSGKAEWVVQDEPGVYISLASLPSGGNELKRVRFSRRHFTEEQAEKWWAEHGTKLLERHNVVAS